MEECPDLKTLRGYLTGGYAFNGSDADEIVAAMEENAKLKLQVSELQKAVAEMLDEMMAGGTPEFFKAKTRAEALIEKPKDERCTSENAGGIRCIKLAPHYGPHTAPGFPGTDDLTWEEKRKDDTCPACNGRGFLQFLEGGEQTTCALCDGKKKV